MSSRILLVPLAGLVLIGTFLAPCCLGGVIVDAGNGSNFSYGWGPLNETNLQWTNDAYVDRLYHETQYYAPSTYYGYVRLASTPYGNMYGSVYWHFRTDASKPFGDDITVTCNANVWASAQGVWASWSTDGVSYTDFFRGDKHTPLETIALKDYGFTGGQDLYVKFYLSRVSGSGGYESVQVFRQSSPTQHSAAQTFVVSSSAPAPVPEPTTLAIWGTLGGLGLIAARRKRKTA